MNNVTPMHEKIEDGFVADLIHENERLKLALQLIHDQVAALMRMHLVGHEGEVP